MCLSLHKEYFLNEVVSSILPVPDDYRTFLSCPSSKLIRLENTNILDYGMLAFLIKKLSDQEQDVFSISKHRCCPIAYNKMIY